MIYQVQKTGSSYLKSSFRSNVLHWVAGVLVLATLGFGVKQAAHSSLFILKQVRVEPLSPGYPLSREKILELARIPEGSLSLFDVRLSPVEGRLLRHPWVKGVVIGKQFPNTLSLKVIERVPIALLNESNGRVLYLEAEGGTFEDQAMVYPVDLPILSGFSASNVEQLKKVHHFIDTWFSTDRVPGLKLSSISYDPKLGLRAMVTYPMKNQKLMRTVLELGLNLEEASLIPGDRLKKVLDYIAIRSTPASKIWLGDGKKVVVKFSRGS